MLQKSKSELVDLIDTTQDLDALVEYLDRYQTQKEDIEYLLNSFQKFTEKTFREETPLKFYAEYLRLFTVAFQRNVLDINSYNIKIAEEIISTIFNKYKVSKSGCLYSARLYKFLYENNVAGYTEKQDAILYLYSRAEALGSTMAASEKERFSEKEKCRAYNLNYYNANYDLTDIIEQIKINKARNFSILLYGPENSGMKEFGEKLFTVLNKNYKCISADNLNTRGNLVKVLNEHQSANLILHHIDTCFNLYNADTDNKDFVSQANAEYLANKIYENKQSTILIVNDIDKLSQNLLDAFPLKIRFDYMNNCQKQSALHNILGLPESNRLDDTGGLVLSDFYRIKEKITLLNITDENSIVEMLKKEAFNKPDFLTYSTPISFFDMNLVNSNTDLVELTAKLEKVSQPFTMLISGPAGTGKSYYLRYLAHKMGKKVIEKTVAELFSKYQGEPAKNVLNLFKQAEDQQAIIILDEVERITGNRENDKTANPWKSDMTAAFLTCLENAKYPFMATTNFISDIDKAILRRFIFKVKFDYLNPEQTEYAFRYNFNQDAPAELLKTGGLTNGDFAVVKKKARILNIKDKFELCKMLKEETTYKAVGHVVHIEQTINFDRSFINIEGNALDLYVKSIKEKQLHNFSILLHGPSGTGKSLYLRHLAQELGYEIIERRASDILSQWYGETEKNIAEAFEEAKNRRAMLIFDEIDTFLPDKSNLKHSHETRIINEFLEQLENHPYPVCATTNYLDNLEQASIRRFKINAKFNYLKKEQYAYIYRKTFGVEPLNNIENLNNLTPAIFASAAEKVALENIGTNSARIFEIFSEEVKQYTGQNSIYSEDKTYEKLLIAPLALYTTPLADNYNNILTSFVKIITDTDYGSGFFITDNGFILTNKHVVKENKIVTIELFSGRHIPAEVIRTNNLDIALIKISSENKTYPLPLKTTEAAIASSVFCLGNPGKDQVLSKGCITRYTKINNTQCIETDCFMDHGASGGPLFDEYGNVIGVNVGGWRSSDLKIPLGLNLHLPINDVLRALNITIKSEK